MGIVKLKPRRRLEGGAVNGHSCDRGESVKQTVRNHVASGAYPPPGPASRSGGHPGAPGGRLLDNPHMQGILCQTTGWIPTAAIVNAIRRFMNGLIPGSCRRGKKMEDDSTVMHKGSAAWRDDESHRDVSMRLSLDDGQDQSCTILPVSPAHVSEQARRRSEAAQAATDIAAGR